MWRDEQIKLYKKYFKKYGVSLHSLGWFNKEHQDLRFKILSEINNLDGKSVLDVGSGFADFYAYLKNINVSANYCGLEFIEEFKDVSINRYPDIKILNEDILERNFDENFDYVFASGIFNARVKNSRHYICSMIEAMFNACKEGMAANMFSTYVDYKERRHYYQKPEALFSYCKSLTKWVTLRHDYMPHEFTVYLYKR